jgi:Zn finger protein HypA/HybF involved in hydrogenase expression
MKTNKINLLREFVDFTCECCHKTEFELSRDGKVIKLQPHRVKQGGEYSLRNIQMVCPNCHGIFSAAQNRAAGFYNGK